MSDPYIVLVGMDFSELADRSLIDAFDLATRRETSRCTSFRYFAHRPARMTRARVPSP